MNIYQKYPESLFLSVLKNESRIALIADRIENLFTALDGLEDPNFWTALDADPKARIWEMMVATILKESRLTPSSSKGEGPDFIVDHQGRRILIEAIVPDLGRYDLPDSVPQIKSHVECQPVPVEQMLLRVRGAIQNKVRAYNTYSENTLVSGEDAQVIAVSSLKLIQARGLLPCLGVTATLGHSTPYLAFDSRTRRTVEEGFLLRSRIDKANGSSVDTLPFLQDAHSFISGVLYSDASPYSSDFALNEESCFIHNPMAKQPVAPGTFKVGHEYWTFFSPDADCWQTIDIAH